MAFPSFSLHTCILAYWWPNCAFSLWCWIMGHGLWVYQLAICLQPQAKPQLVHNLVHKFAVCHSLGATNMCTSVSTGQVSWASQDSDVSLRSSWRPHSHPPWLCGKQHSKVSLRESASPPLLDVQCDMKRAVSVEGLQGTWYHCLEKLCAPEYGSGT